ncbi:MAG: alpha/beta hydrolase [Pseudoflavonifractor sp.]|nr:alpha/beta hydrolase [Pseudoflavonifractor sp.]
MRQILILMMLMSAAASAMADGWKPDILDGYEYRYVTHPDDYSGPVRSTIVRRQSPCGGNRGVLYVHGFNDYFFQKEMGDIITDSCVNFYAVDLRKYGRSLTDGQKPFQVRDLREYYADIDSAVAQMKHDGINHIILMGHSTGGLTSSLYMAEKPDDSIAGLILNSPFLDWNLGSIESAVPFVSAIGSWLPGLAIPQGGGNAYSESLLKSGHGEWSYNTDWKMPKSPDVDAGWVRAIDRAQSTIKNGVEIATPILLMRSDKSGHGSEWTPEASRTDMVLDVDDIGKYGRRLGRQVTSIKVRGGLHDLVLSSPTVRNAVYDRMFRWMDDIGFR